MVYSPKKKYANIKLDKAHFFLPFQEKYWNTKRIRTAAFKFVKKNHPFISTGCFIFCHVWKRLVFKHVISDSSRIPKRVHIDSSCFPCAFVIWFINKQKFVSCHSNKFDPSGSLLRRQKEMYFRLRETIHENYTYHGTKSFWFYPYYLLIFVLNKS